MNVLIGSFFTLLFLAIALDSQGAGRFDELDVLEPVIANGTVIGNPNDPIARSTVLILGVERSGHNGISYNGGSICTGTIISPALVVTAAHCVVEDDTETPMSPSSLLVEMALFYDGESPLPRPSSVRVSSVRRHPGYRNRGAKNDIALIRLAGPIKPGYRPANVISQSQSLQEGKSVVVAGYGATSLTSNPSSFRLRFFEYEIKELDPEVTWVDLSSSRPGGIGNGDSGGPAFVRMNSQLLFWGVASTSSETNYSVVNYESVQAFRTWLVEAAESMGSVLELP